MGLSGRRGRAAVLALALLLTVGCDQVSKALAERRLSDGGTVVFAGGALALQLAHNRGAFLSLGHSLPESARVGFFVVCVGCCLAAALAFLFRTRSWRLAPSIGLALALGGGLGNFADRLTRGSVTDFLVIRLGPLRTGIFNAADAAIVAGAAVVATAWARRGVH